MKNDHGVEPLVDTAKLAVGGLESHEGPIAGERSPAGMNEPASMKRFVPFACEKKPAVGSRMTGRSSMSGARLA